MAKNSSVNGLHVHHFPGSEHGIVVFPGLGISSQHAFYQQLGDLDHSVYVVELRGHGKSEGEWSLDHHRQDIAHVLREFKGKHNHLFTVASGLSASLLLEHEHMAHEQNPKGQPLPDGMVLLHPTMEGATLLPKDSLTTDVLRAMPLLNQTFLRGMLEKMNKAKGHVDRPKNWGKAHYGFCRVPKHYVKMFWEQLASYTMPKVRVQTPTTIFLPRGTSDHLTRIYGNTRMKQVSWMVDDPSKAEHAHAVQEVTNALQEIMKEEVPIRFKH
ncbi:MAG: alpha/beta fold hydrolase [Candidatus Woesearchaeota archaeon]|nr:alpha/beta fold hydrolase [Candidatus Woesearchaeota archaeon]